MANLLQKFIDLFLVHDSIHIFFALIFCNKMLLKKFQARILFLAKLTYIFSYKWKMLILLHLFNALTLAVFRRLNSLTLLNTIRSIIILLFYILWTLTLTLYSTNLISLISLSILSITNETLTILHFITKINYNF